MSMLRLYIVPCVFNFYAGYMMWISGWMNHKPKSRSSGEIQITSDTQMTSALWQKVKKNYKASWWKWKQRVKSCLKTQHSKTKMMASGPISSVQSLSHVQYFETPWIAAGQTSLSIVNFWVYSNSCPLSQWCHPTISSSFIPFSSCLQSFPASGPFSMSQLFASGGQSFGLWASTSVLPMNTQDFRMDWMDLLAVQGTLRSLLQQYSSKASNLQHSAFFIVQLSHPYMTLLEKP